MDLVEEFTFHASLKKPLPVGAGPIGTRMYYEVTGGEIKGDRIRGKLLGGGEWALVGPDGLSGLMCDCRSKRMMVRISTFNM